jgi:hypothetical protein
MRISEVFRSKKLPFVLIAFSFLISYPVFAGRWSLKTPLTRVLETGTLRPTGGGFFEDFDAPYLYDGKLVFRGYTDVRRDNGIYTDFNGAISTVADTTIKPAGDRRNFIAFNTSTSPKVRYQNIPRLSKKGRIVFLGNGFGNGLTGLYVWKKNKLHKMVDRKTIIPGGTRGLFTTFLEPQFIQGDQVIFIGYGDVEKGITGIYQAKDLKHIKTLVDDTTPIPGVKKSALETFQEFLELSTSRNTKAEDFVFVGRGKANRLGIYRYDRGKLTTIADTNMEIPEGVGFFNQLSDVQLDGDTDQIAFLGNGVLGQKGIYLYKNGELHKVVDQRDVIPNSGGETFLTFSHISFDRGMMVFSANGLRHREAIYLYSSKGIFKLMSQADEINKQKIAEIKIGSGALSDEKLAMCLQLQNNKRTLFVGQLDYSRF